VTPALSHTSSYATLAIGNSHQGNRMATTIIEMIHFSRYMMISWEGCTFRRYVKLDVKLGEERVHLFL